VRNSGAHAVVEGVGDHGCEYMTGGIVVVLGTTGRNFAAGMSGGVAYVLDEDGAFASRCNMGMVVVEELDDDGDALVRDLVREHVSRTGSVKGAALLGAWASTRHRVKKVMATEYKRALETTRAAAMRTAVT
jgi:glutamate synthase (ferredoxin)